MGLAEIKICGVNHGEFAREAERLGADYLGFIRAEESPRFVTAAQAKAIIGGLTGKARTVGVWTRFPDLEEAKDTGFKVLQLHYRANEEEVAKVKAAGFECWTLAGGAKADANIFDKSHGDGEKDMKKTEGRAVLAGGIGAHNIGEALASGAAVVDLSGSLERERGVKDMGRLRELFAAIAAARAKGAGQ